MPLSTRGENQGEFFVRMFFICVQIMEVELESMHRQLEVHENKMKGGCCRIS